MSYGSKRWITLDERLSGFVVLQDLLRGERRVGDEGEETVAACIVVDLILTKRPSELEAAEEQSVAGHKFVSPRSRAPEGRSSRTPWLRSS